MNRSLLWLLLLLFIYILVCPKIVAQTVKNLPTMQET